MGTSVIWTYVSKPSRFPSRFSKVFFRGECKIYCFMPRSGGGGFEYFSLVLIFPVFKAIILSQWQRFFLLMMIRSIQKFTPASLRRWVSKLLCVTAGERVLSRS